MGMTSLDAPMLCDACKVKMESDPVAQEEGWEYELMYEKTFLGLTKEEWKSIGRIAGTALIVTILLFVFLIAAISLKG